VSERRSAASTISGDWLRVAVSVFFIGMAWASLLWSVHDVKAMVAGIGDRVTTIEHYLEKESKGDFVPAVPNDPKPNWRAWEAIVLIELIIFLVIVGVLLYLIPMDAQVKRIITILIVIVVLLWLVSAFGLLPDFRNYPLRR
jgi:hypothetical protein